VTSWNAGATYTRTPLTFTAEYQRERADDPILRTDFLDRDRYKVRLGWSEKGLLHVSATGEQIDSSNDRPGIAYDATIREYGGDLEITPVKAFRARFSAIEYDATSTLLFRVPQDFSTATSYHREKGLSLEGGISLVLPRVTLDGSYMVFTNRGSYAFTIGRARAAADVPVNAHVAILAEWMRDKYNDVAQNLGNLGKFAANRMGLYIRWRN
jgi:hypothetical protein